MGGRALRPARCSMQTFTKREKDARARNCASDAEEEVEKERYGWSGPTGYRDSGEGCTRRDDCDELFSSCVPGMFMCPGVLPRRGRERSD